MITLRIDVDYAYPSRLKSIVKMVFKIKKQDKDYLKNCMIIAKLINQSKKEIKAYWFFTSYTIPNKELLTLLNEDKHEIGLHLIKNGSKETSLLQQITQKTIQYYSIHGTKGVCNQLLWGRNIGQQQTNIPIDFPLKSIHEFATSSLDFGVIQEDAMLSLHPDWLFKKSKSDRGPTIKMLTNLLQSNDNQQTEKAKT